MGAIDNGALVWLSFGQHGVSQGNFAVKSSGNDSDRWQKRRRGDVSDKGVPVSCHVGK